jgi:DNA topoisomerase I
VESEAINEARVHIENTFGKNYLPEAPRVYSTKKAAQDAHEAIRPTNLHHTPDSIEKFLSKPQFQLYKLIWQRFVASQMESALYDTLSANILAGTEIVLRATGSILKFPGFLAVYEEKEDEDNLKESDKKLPPLQEAQKLELEKVTSEQGFTRPPPRFSEASLIKELEKQGIGRPSTYEAIMNKIQGREYTAKESGRLKPTELGRIVVDMLETHFQEIMNIDFTVKMEDDLEAISENKIAWKALIKDFWNRFIPTLAKAEESAFVPKVLTSHICPDCGKSLQKIWYKSRFFFGCAGYPECKYSIPAEELQFNREDYADHFNFDQSCPQCAGKMKVRHGRFGAFLGCLNYPECKGIINIPKKGEEVIDESTLPPCPATGCPGKIVSKKSRFGKTFFACSTYPECNVIGNTLDQLETKYKDHARTAAEKKAPKKKGVVAKKTTAKKVPAAKKTRKMPTLPLSKDLSKLLGVKELTRGEVLKQVWVYIRAHNLQDPQDKRMIIPDAQLEKVLGTKEPVSMFAMTKLLSAHIGKEV